MGNATDIILYIGEVFKLTEFKAPGQFLTEALFPEAFASGRMNYLSTFALADVIWFFGIYGLPFASIYLLIIIRCFVFLKSRAIHKEVWIGFSGAVFYSSNFMSSFSPYVLSAPIVFIFVILIINWRSTGFNFNRYT